MLNILSKIAVVVLSLIIFAGSASCTDRQWEYTGTTMSGLLSSISSHGSGTYVITNTVIVDSAYTIGANEVRITTRYTGTQYQPATFSYTSNSGKITVTGKGVIFDNCHFLPTSDNFAGVLLEFDGQADYSGSQQCKVERCAFAFNHGDGILDNGAYSLSVVDPLMYCHGGTQWDYGHAFHLVNHAMGFQLCGHGGSRGTFGGAINVFVENAEGIVIDNYMSYESKFGLFLQPTDSNSIHDIICTATNFDTTHSLGSPVRSWSPNANVHIRNLYFTGCWMYSASDGAQAYSFDQIVDYLSIVGGRAESTYGAQPIVLAAGSSNYILSACHVIDN